jgi:hypothetical protein
MPAKQRREMKGRKGVCSVVEKLVGFVAPNNCPLQLVQDCPSQFKLGLIRLETKLAHVPDCAASDRFGGHPVTVSCPETGCDWPWHANFQSRSSATAAEAPL